MIGAFVEELLAQAEREMPGGVSWRIEVRGGDDEFVTLRAMVSRHHAEFRWSRMKIRRIEDDAVSRRQVIADGIELLKRRVAAFPPTALDTLG